VLLLAVLTGCSGEPSEAEAAVPDAAESPSAAPPPGPASDPADLATVRRYTEMFYRGELDSLFEKFSDEMKEVIPRERLAALHERAVTEFGSETRVIGEDSQTKGDYRAFVRWARFDGTEDVIEIQWILRPDDEIAGFYIRPARKRVRGEGDGALQP
jgi:hypothetical protein